MELSNPVNATLGLPSSAEVALQDDDGLNAVEFDSPQYGVVEISGAVQVRVKATRGADPNQVLTVELSLGATGDTAVLGVDYGLSVFDHHYLSGRCECPGCNHPGGE